MSKCGQVGSPTTDNSELTCDEYFDAICIIIAQGHPFIEALPNTSLEEIIFKLVEKLKNQQRQINNSTIDITNLTNLLNDAINRIEILENN